jgi:type IV secretion system protein VirD4
MSQYNDIIGDPSPEAVEFGRIVLDNGSIGGKLRYGGERHMLVFGANGSGKGTRILVPNLLNMSGNRSVVAVDPSGELAAICAPYRRQLGQRVYILNPFRVLTEYQGYEDMEGYGFNPLAALDPAATSFNVDASLLAEAMIPLDPNTTPHWNTSARALVAAIGMYAAIEAKKGGGVPTMARVRELLCQASGEGRRAVAGLKEVKPTGIPALAREMMQSALAPLRNKASQFTDWNNEIAGIASTAKIQTECFDDPEIADVLARNDFDFAEVKRRPTTVFLVLPPLMMERHGKWLRLMLTSALRATLRERQAREPSILFMLDEFPALGHLQIIENAWAQVRKYGIQMMPVFQDLNQLQAIYDKRWETFVGNAGVVASFAPNDVTTAEWLSKRMGETTRMQTSVSDNYGFNKGSNAGRSSNPGGGGSSQGESDGESWSKNSSTSPIRVPFMSPDELYGMKTGNMVMISAGLSNAAPIFARAYYKMEKLKARARINPYVEPVPRRAALPKHEPVARHAALPWWQMASDSGTGGPFGSRPDWFMTTEIFGSPTPSIPEYDATVKWYSPEKGYGVVNLPDGIASLHANVLQEASYSKVNKGDTLRVQIQQGQNGRLVSKVISVNHDTF